MRRELDGKNYIEHYVQSLTHELKTPLASLTASSELLTQAETLTAKQSQQLHGLIQHQIRRLHTTIDAILQLATLEADAKIQAEFIALADVMQELNATFGARMKAKHCTLVTRIEITTLWGARELFVMALNNLIDNALAFTCSDSAIVLAITPDGPEHCRIALSNDGPVIPDYALNRVTERFYSLPRPDGSGKSTGLGLNFVAAIARRHGAELNLMNLKTGVVAQLNHWPVKPRNLS